MDNLFSEAGYKEIIRRINTLTPESQRKWGSMSVGKMLAHCNVMFELTFENKHEKPRGIKKFLLKTFVKPFVVGPKSYKKNTRTAPEFIITSESDFNKEKKRLLDYLAMVNELGESYFEGRDYHSFGVLKASEWNVMFSKHLDHHLTQFGA